MKFSVDLSGAQLRAVDKLAAQTGLSREEFVQRVVEDYLEQKITFQRAFGLKKDDPVEGLGYQEGLRSEWSDTA